ncbi:MAG: hypothetical protein IT384_11430 [Deltaproteobacteria bacterium]|nr:hypothetical protein [Deltaproteobacteria bacterium]
MTLAFWIALGVFSLLSALTLRLTVRFLARGADNGWDNAVAYLAASGLVLYFPVRWMLGSDSWTWWALAAPLVWLVQVVTLRAVYEINTWRAVLVGIVHTVTTSVVTGAVTVTAGIIAAYILYGQIITDPVRVIRMILRWLGIEIPGLE